MADWGPVMIAVVLFVLLTPGLLVQIPGRNRLVEFGNMQTSGVSILVHAIIYFGLVTIFLIAIGVHIYTGSAIVPIGDGSVQVPWGSQRGLSVFNHHRQRGGERPQLLLRQDKGRLGVAAEPGRRHRAGADNNSRFPRPQRHPKLARPARGAGEGPTDAEEDPGRDRRGRGAQRHSFGERGLQQGEESMEQSPAEEVPTPSDHGHPDPLVPADVRNERVYVLRPRALQDHRIRQRRLPHVGRHHRRRQCPRHHIWRGQVGTPPALSPGWRPNVHLPTIKYGVKGNPGELPKWYAALLVVMICIYISGFAWSWGPLGWLVPSEIFPLEIRSAAQSVTVSVNMIFTFFVAEIFITMLCHFKFGLFIFFAFFVIMMTAFVYFFLPETKAIPIEEMSLVWKSHWFWSKFVSTDHDFPAKGRVAEP